MAHIEVWLDETSGPESKWIVSLEDEASTTLAACDSRSQAEEIASTEAAQRGLKVEVK